MAKSKNKTRIITRGNWEHRQRMPQALLEKYGDKLSPNEINEILRLGFYMFRPEGLAYEEVEERLGVQNFQEDLILQEYEVSKSTRNV